MIRLGDSRTLAIVAIYQLAKLSTQDSPKAIIKAVKKYHGLSKENQKQIKNPAAWDEQAISLVRRAVRRETGITEPELEFTFSPAPQPSTFRQSEFPWRYKLYRRPNFEAFKRLRHLLGRANKP